MEKKHFPVAFSRFFFVLRSFFFSLLLIAQQKTHRSAGRGKRRNQNGRTARDPRRKEAARVDFCLLSSFFFLVFFFFYLPNEKYGRQAGKREGRNSGHAALGGVAIQKPRAIRKRIGVFHAIRRVRAVALSQTGA